MKLKLYFAFALVVLLPQQKSKAQSAADYAVQLQATVQTAPPKVILNWVKIPGATNYNIQKKAKSSSGWTFLISTTDTFYTDIAVASDSAYEYHVSNTGGSVAAHGYLLAGINAPALHSRGTLILLVDTLFRDSCATELSRLMHDLSGDGWSIVRHNINRTTIDTSIKNLIKNDYNTIANTKAVLIIGHIAVPYSGEINPDGHPDHLGAWPTDLFYADMDGVWTDALVNNSTASRTQNKNIPGDGKWDQSAIPSDAELQISRIDFSNMPAFAKSEVLMMKSYLSKAHQYKTDSLYISHKALVDDNFGGFSGEAFAANAWRNFPGFIGRSNIINADFVTTLNDSAYQWALGCGGGSYTTCSGVGATSDFTGKKQKGIFTMLFGSYFGDWDSQNNFLRAPLCSDEPALTSCWAGRPNWFFHHMSLGENIGYSTMLTQNTGAVLYSPGGYGAKGVHVALMGDLSLRTEYIKPASALTITAIAKGGATIAWAASPDPTVLGYYVYRSDSLYGSYIKISGLTSGTSFKDTVGINGLHYYMVRPSKLQQTPSGTYYNLGLGISDSATVIFPKPASIASLPNEKGTLLCFPNPTNTVLNIYCNLNTDQSLVVVNITDIIGKVMLQSVHQTQQKEFTISENISHFAPGTYFLQLMAEQKLLGVQKVIKQ